MSAPMEISQEKPHVPTFGWPYTCAIALNNIAVSLMSRRHANEAMETFSDAINVLRNAAKENQPEYFMEVTEKVHQAQKKLSDCHRMASKPSLPELQGIDLRIITEEDIAGSVRNFAQYTRGAPPASVLKVFLIRIELLTTQQSERQKHFGGLVAALLLHNFGNSYLSMAVAEKEPQRALELWEVAYKLFQLACSNLVAISSKNFTIEYDELTVRLFPLSVLVLQSLDRIATVLGMLIDARTYHSTMLDVLESFLRMDVLYGVFAKDAAAAAA